MSLATRFSRFDEMTRIMPHMYMYAYGNPKEKVHVDLGLSVTGLRLRSVHGHAWTGHEVKYGKWAAAGHTRGQGCNVACTCPC